MTVLAWTDPQGLMVQEGRVAPAALSADSYPGVCVTGLGTCGSGNKRVPTAAAQAPIIPDAYCPRPCAFYAHCHSPADAGIDPGGSEAPHAPRALSRLRGSTGRRRRVPRWSSHQLKRLSSWSPKAYKPVLFFHPFPVRSAKRLPILQISPS